LKNESVLVSRYINFVWKKACSFSNNYADIQDLSQEGLLALLKAARTYNPQFGVPFQAYAETCVSNRLKSEAVKLKKRQAGASELSDDSDGGTDISPESILLEKEFTENIYSEFSSLLSRREWAVFRHYLDGLSYSQIAKRLNLPEKSVDNAVYRARKKIRQLISDSNYKQLFPSGYTTK